MQDAIQTTVRRRWVELDLLRSLALVLMILNHVAVEVQQAQDAPFIDAMNFVGSFAPVLFFFLTGLGNGVQSIGKASDRGFQTLVKIGVLLAADVFLWIHPGQLVGMDFLGFIALSAFLLKKLQRIPRSGTAAVILAGLVLASRFAIGSMLRTRLSGLPFGAILNSMLGVESMDGFPYPLAPWLAYPLLGYALGRMIARNRSWIEDHRPRVVGYTTLATLGLAAGTAVMTLEGAVIFRWGTVSFAFFVASLASLGASLAAAVALGGRPASASLGAAAQQSFAVVPLHYALLAAAVALLGSITGNTLYLIVTFWVVLLSFIAASLVSRASAAFRSAGQGLVNLVWILVFSASLAGAVLLATTTPSHAVNVAVRSVCQLSLCLLLGLPLPAQTRTEAEQDVQYAQSA